MGLGYVGVPLVQAAVGAGLTVVGYDVDPHKVNDLNAGRSHVDDLSDRDMAEMLSSGFLATTDPSVLDSADAVVICVPTPLGSDGYPDLKAVESATRTIASHLHTGMLVVLESTTYPGTTDELLLPVLSESGLVVGRDFFLAFSPERIDPGNPRFGVVNTPKIIGGCTPECTGAAEALYGKFVDRTVSARGTREAEMAKLLENTYRHVNIALMNEMAVFCHELGIDLWDSISCAATKPFGFQAFYPGPGVGGHCIPIDPNYLSYKVRTLGYPFRFVELAQEINARMPAYVVQRAQAILNECGKALKGARILLVGVTYKADIGDERESPARPIARRLIAAGAEVRYHDPYVREWRVDGATIDGFEALEDATSGVDLVVLLQAHKHIEHAQLVASASRVLDTRGILRGPNVQAL
ncbi:MAG: nucleotide sugar dehydrogenase [Actinomycetes bacterium]